MVSLGYSCHRAFSSACLFEGLSFSYVKAGLCCVEGIATSKAEEIHGEEIHTPPSCAIFCTECMVAFIETCMVRTNFDHVCNSDLA